MPSTERAATARRARLIFAAGVGVLLVGAVLLIAAGGGGGERASVPLDPACVRAWNADPAALAIGRHNLTFHDYETAQVTHLDVPAGERLGGDERPCAVVFPSRTLDLEPAAAAVALLGETWTALAGTKGFDEVRLAELQAEALADPNVALDAEGRLREIASQSG